MKFDRVAYWSDTSTASKELREYNKGRFFKFSQPDFYIDMTWGQRLIESAFKYMNKDWSILELGCNTGKTLAYLKENGFHKVMGVEINKKAIQLGRERFPLLQDVEIINAPIENVIKDINRFDVIYSSGVYMHIPYEFDWVFEEISNHARKMIFTSEDEVQTTFERFARNYKDMFEGWGWKQIEEEPGTNFPPLPETTTKRIFTRS